jgi:hypothetical protein
VTELAASPGVLDQPGVIAFLVIFGMGIILVFVFRSMAKHLRKVNMAARAEAEAAARAEAAGEEAGPDDQGGSSGRGVAGSSGRPGSAG